MRHHRFVCGNAAVFPARSVRAFSRTLLPCLPARLALSRPALAGARRAARDKPSFAAAPA
jgi:hypothetical protein